MSEDKKDGINVTPLETMFQAVVRAERDVWRKVEASVKAHWPPPPGFSVCVGRMEVTPVEDDVSHLFTLKSWVGIFPSNAIPPNCIEVMMPGEEAPCES